MTKYSFKLHLKDGTSKMAGGKSNLPENLKYDFDGMVSWEEYNRIADDKTITGQDVANMAKKFYNKFEDGNIVYVEIIDVFTNEVVVRSDNEEDKIVEILYTNWKGETAIRHIVPKDIFFGSTEWHKEEQWLLNAFDVDKQADRACAIKDIKSWKEI